MTTQEFKSFTEEFIRHIHVDPTTCDISYQELNDGNIQIASFPLKTKAWNVEGSLQRSHYLVAECAPTPECFPTQRDFCLCAKEFSYTVMLFSSPSLRVRMVKKLNAREVPENLMGVYLFDKQAPLVILIPHSKTRQYKPNFNFEIYEAKSDPIKGQLCADICVTFTQLPNPALN